MLGVLLEPLARPVKLGKGSTEISERQIGQARVEVQLRSFLGAQLGGSNGPKNDRRVCVPGLIVRGLSLPKGVLAT
ncbi:MAG: hypothetical protein RJA70_1822 [Pseudomonadota bacterium]|jgi:hypothetical protein